MAYYVEVEDFVVPKIVELSIAKNHLKIEDDFTEEDVLVQGYVDAAVDWLSSYLGYAVAKQQYLVSAASFNEVLVSSLQKVISIDSVQYKDVNGDLQTFDKDQCKIDVVDKFETKLSFLTDEFPEVQANKQDAVQLTLTVGLKKVKKQINQAILLLVGDFYEFRSNRPSKTSEDTVKNLVSVLRKPC